MKTLFIHLLKMILLICLFSAIFLYFSPFRDAAIDFVTAFFQH